MFSLKRATRFEKENVFLDTAFRLLSEINFMYLSSIVAMRAQYT